MAMAWKQLIMNKQKLPCHHIWFLDYQDVSPHPACTLKVGIPEFLNRVGRGVETHVSKLETEIGDFQKLLVTRTLKLKKLGIPCKHRKLILKYTQV